MDSRRKVARERKLNIDLIDIATPVPAFVTATTQAQIGPVLAATVHVFDSVSALRKYCRKTKGFFPKIDAKKDGFLKVLLRQLVHFDAKKTDTTATKRKAPKPAPALTPNKP